MSLKKDNMCNIKENVTYQEFGLCEIDVISLSELLRNGIEIRRPENAIMNGAMELEVVFNSNNMGSLSLFDRIFMEKYKAIESRPFVRKFTFYNVNVYFAFMNDINKLIKLEWYAQKREANDGNIAVDIIEKLDYVSREVFAELMDAFKISVRSVNVLSIAEIDTIRKFLEFHKLNLGFKGLKNCGKISNEELTAFADEIINNNLRTLCPEDSQSIQDYDRLMRYLTSQDRNFANLLHENNLIEQFLNRKINLFNFIDLFLKVVLDDKSYYINDVRYFGWFDKQMSHNDIAHRLNITSVESRKLYDAGKIKIKRRLKALFKDNSYIYNYLETENIFDNDMVIADRSFFDSIRKTEKVNYNDHFIAEVLEIVYSNNYSSVIIEGIGLILLNKKYRFNISEFTHSLINHLNEKRDKDVIFNLELMIAKYSGKIDPLLIDDLTELCETMLKECFNITVVNREFILKKNTSKYLTEFAVEILEETDRPMQIDEIIYELNIKYPTANIVRPTVLHYMYQNPNIIHIGRNSKFGLRIWEADPERKFKGGTIGDIVYEYLSTCHREVHIDTITAYVTQYRTTTKYNIHQNLILDTKKRFKYIGGGYFEINRKNNNHV